MNEGIGNLQIKNQRTKMRSHGRRNLVFGKGKEVSPSSVPTISQLDRGGVENIEVPGKQILFPLMAAEILHS